MTCNCDCKKCRAIHDGCDCYDNSKMRYNTDFWCCDSMKKFLDREGLTLKEVLETENIKFCPYCGKILSSLV